MYLGFQEIGFSRERSIWLSLVGGGYVHASEKLMGRSLEGSLQRSDDRTNRPNLVLSHSEDRVRFARQLRDDSGLSEFWLSEFWLDAIGPETTLNVFLILKPQ